jgi:uncharacterized glyoxalase superfamily protein PhnB
LLFNTFIKRIQLGSSPKVGITHHEFREREWGTFGRCTDKFGINWMVNAKK